MTINEYGHMLPSVDAALADGLGKLFDAAMPEPVSVGERRNAATMVGER